MTTDVLVLNTAVLELRSRDFTFADSLAGKGGSAKCRTMDMPAYTQEQLRGWIEAGAATPGGAAIAAALMARAGLKVSVGVNLGRGNYGGLDIQGRTLYDLMASSGVDLSEACVHPNLPTGTTFVGEAGDGERGGTACFPNANNDFDFEHFRGSVERLKPRVVYYMSSGLSDRGDASGGRDLADFMRWCRSRGCLTIADSHPPAGAPGTLIERGERVDALRLLEPLLLELDLFVASDAEAKLMVNTLERPRRWSGDDAADAAAALDVVTEGFGPAGGRMRLAGVTGAHNTFEKHILPDGAVSAVRRIDSRFPAASDAEPSGAETAFQAGLLSSVARHADAFRSGRMDVAEAVQMGHLFASLFSGAPPGNRFGTIASLTAMQRLVRAGRSYATFDELREALAPENA